jgi:hypothetical protein
VIRGASPAWAGMPKQLLLSLLSQIQVMTLASQIDPFRSSSNRLI